MNEKQYNFLSIFFLLLVVTGSIYAANKKPYVPAEITELLRENQLTESDWNYVRCYLHFTSQKLLDRQGAYTFCHSINLDSIGRVDK